MGSSKSYPPEQYIEHFGTHINNYISTGVGVSFMPYVHYIAGSVDVNETCRLNSVYESSLGALVHIDMSEDGIMVESGYTRNSISEHHYFTFTIMETPLGYEHPVADNRRFGIFKLNGFYYLTLQKFRCQ